MSGFANVSGMSYEDVRRMGHSDDYVEHKTFNRNPYAYRKPMNKTPRVTINHNADDVWAAAAQAQSINGCYIKNLADVAEGQTVKTNRQIVESLLSDTLNISEENRALGKKVRSYFQAFTFKILQGKQLNEFNNTAMLIANRDVISTVYDLAVICSLPATYEKSSKRDTADRRINFAHGGYVGEEGIKVTLNIEVLKQMWSEKWNTWYLTGITDEDQVVFFAFRTQYDIGTHLTIQGTVKAHRDNSTQLNRVKVL